MKKRLIDFIKLVTFLSVLAGLSAWLANYSATEISGAARVIDGDSLSVNGREVRLFGIDAPEYRQMCKISAGETKTYTCGANAAHYLKGLVSAKTVMCKGQGTDKYDRLLAVCKAGDLELNRQMVMQGWAISFGDYEGEEFSAKKQGLGLWRGDFEAPSNWRRNEREKHTGSWFGSLFPW